MKLKHGDVLKYIEKLPYATFKDVAIHYANNHSIDVNADLDNIITTDFQKRLEKLEINNVCPECGAKHIMKYGKRNQVQRYRCKKCNHQFSLFSNTILEKTKFHWDTWITVMELTLNGYSLNEIRHKLVEDYHYHGIDRKTIFLWRHKIVNALASIPQPRLSGVVQVDETFVREAQKGSRTLVSYLSKDDVREPRYGQSPSKYGVMGSEFATITTAIDNTGHCVCKVTGLGKLTPDVFLDKFEYHLNAPAYICSDANPVYKDYCNIFNITHYERPSNYYKRLQERGYQTPSRTNEALADKQREANNIIKLKMYDEKLIDRISNKGDIDYKEFNNIKTDNSLSLARVNSLHKEIKRFINKNMTNVSTKYLEDYIGFFAYLHNYKVDHQVKGFSRKDAEAILIEILKHQSKYTITDLKKTELELPKPSPRYLTLLKTYTERARRITNNKYFKFDEEDKVVSFDKRNYLLELPDSRIKSICKKYDVKYKRKWIKWSIVSEILKHPKIADIFIELIELDKTIQVTQEDLEYISKEQFRKTS